MNKDTILSHYIQAALWTADLEGSDKKVHPESIKQAKKDIDSFVEQAGGLLDGMDASQVGHDFWLTRCHEGAGFWDRDLGEVGEKLTEISHKFKELHVFGDEEDDEFVIE